MLIVFWGNTGNALEKTSISDLLGWFSHTLNSISISHGNNVSGEVEIAQQILFFLYRNLYSSSNTFCEHKHHYTYKHIHKHKPNVRVRNSLMKEVVTPKYVANKSKLESIVLFLNYFASLSSADAL